MTNDAGAADDRYTVISADCHGGGEIHEYRDYLPSAYHDEFDAWVAGYEIGFADLLGDDGKRNWDSERRRRDLEDDGIVAEVIFPNTIPPFFANGSLVTQPPPADAHEAELRWVGLQAHNRWLADFCAALPGRRAGIAQISLYDVEASVAEVRRTREAGLTGGVLLPGAPPGVGLLPLHHRHYDPLWQVCEELDVPVNHHGGSAGPPRGDTPEDTIMFLLEVTWWSHQVLTNLIVGGALDRHPSLRLVFTEQGTAWVPEQLRVLDYFFDRMRNAVGSQEHEWGAPVMEKLALQPSEYWARQCHVGASFIRRSEVPFRDEVGVDRIMWGSDYPHKEASYPFSREAIQLSFHGVPRPEVDAMLAGNAARVYGFDLDALRPLGREIGPLVSSLDVPLAPEDFPDGSQKCPAFAERTPAAV
jgi:predicted TIM-barrel fold metal-dependent hydrolase